VASGAVGGILGGVQLVSGFVGGSQQSNAQRQALQAQAQNTVDASRIRQMELLQANDAAKFTYSMNELQRQQNFSNQSFLVERQSLQERIDVDATKQQAEQQYLSALSAAQKNDNETNAQMSIANVNFEKTLQGIAEQLGAYNSQANTDVNSAANALRELGDRVTTRDVLAMASGIDVGSSTTDQQQNADLMNTIQQVSSVLVGTNVGLETQQKLADISTSASDAERRVKLNQLGEYLTSSDTQRAIAEIQRNATNTNVNSTSQLNSIARDTATQTLNAADAINRQTDATNREFSSSGFNIQNSANNSATRNALSGINAQYGSIGNNTFNSLLTGGINAYNTYSGVLSQQRQLDQAKSQAYLNNGLLDGRSTTNNVFPGYN
jgi:hypothetical protein